MRNWKWFVPVGCFGTLILFVAFVGSIALIVFSAMKSTDVYKEALARAQGAPFRNRGSRVADQRGISCLWKHKRERRIR